MRVESCNGVILLYLWKNGTVETAFFVIDADFRWGNDLARPGHHLADGGGLGKRRLLHAAVGARGNPFAVGGDQRRRP